MRLGTTTAFVALWCLITFTFDALILREIAAQHASGGYSRTAGKVLASGVTDAGGEDSVHYVPKVEYEYVVGGRTYRGSRYRVEWMYTHRPDDGRPFARRVAGKYEPGQPVWVHHDPADPGKAVLDPGLQGTPLFALLALAPFNAIAVIGLGLLLARRRRAERLPAGVQFLDKVEQVRVRMISTPPWVWAVGAAGVAGLAATFVTMALSIEPELGAMSWMLALVAGAALAAYFKAVDAIADGRHDLVIDWAEQRVALPHRPGWPRVLLPLADLTGFDVETQVVGSDGGDTETVHELVLRTPRAERLVVHRSRDRDAEMALLEELRGRLDARPR